VALPKRTAQQKAESESYAILLYQLRSLGIFRNVTENDYGIDFEVELVLNHAVTGNYFKAQVKAADKITIRKKDGVPTVGGVKQSTLNYWCELSFRTHVIAYAVDLQTENIYVSRPLFWQATRLLDGGGKTKTIEFLPSKTANGKISAIAQTLMGATAPSARDELSAHANVLKHLDDCLELYADVFHYDA